MSPLSLLAGGALLLWFRPPLLSILRLVAFLILKYWKVGCFLTLRYWKCHVDVGAAWSLSTHHQSSNQTSGERPWPYAHVGPALGVQGPKAPQTPSLDKKLQQKLEPNSFSVPLKGQQDFSLYRLWWRHVICNLPLVKLCQSSASWILKEQKSWRNTFVMSILSETRCRPEDHQSLKWCFLFVYLCFLSRLKRRY